MIAQNLQKLIGESMKAGNFRRTETLRMLSSAFNYERIALQHALTEGDELNIIKKQVKQRRDSIEAYDKAGREDLSKTEKEELAILQEFLPPEMPEEELSQLVNNSIIQLGAKTIQDMGKVIATVKNKAPNADGGRVAALVKQKLEV
jgi:uncharacterized protein